MELTKYELARIIGARAFQLYSGAPPVVSEISDKELEYVKLAEKELYENVIPLAVKKDKGEKRE